MEASIHDALRGSSIRRSGARAGGRTDPGECSSGGVLPCKGMVDAFVRLERPWARRSRELRGPVAAAIGKP